MVFGDPERVLCGVPRKAQQPRSRRRGAESDPGSGRVILVGRRVKSQTGPRRDLVGHTKGCEELFTIRATFRKRCCQGGRHQSAAHMPLHRVQTVMSVKRVRGHPKRQRKARWRRSAPVKGHWNGSTELRRRVLPDDRRQLRCRAAGCDAEEVEKCALRLVADGAGDVRPARAQQKFSWIHGSKAFQVHDPGSIPFATEPGCARDIDACPVAPQSAPMTKTFTGSFTQQLPLPEEAIAAATEAMRHGRLHRYNTAPGEVSETALLEGEFAAYTGARYCLAVASGGAAMTLALRAAGVGQGDPVLSNAFTLAPVPGAISAVGAAPVFVEVTESLTLDLSDLEAKIATSGARDTPSQPHARTHLRHGGAHGALRRRGCSGHRGTAPTPWGQPGMAWRLVVTAAPPAIRPRPTST